MKKRQTLTQKKKENGRAPSFSSPSVPAQWPRLFSSAKVLMVFLFIYLRPHWLMWTCVNNSRPVVALWFPLTFFLKKNY